MKAGTERVNRGSCDPGNSMGRGLAVAVGPQALRHPARQLDRLVPEPDLQSGAHVAHHAAGWHGPVVRWRPALPSDRLLVRTVGHVPDPADPGRGAATAP